MGLNCVETTATIDKKYSNYLFAFLNVHKQGEVKLKWHLGRTCFDNRQTVDYLVLGLYIYRGEVSQCALKN